jgi:Flp pilus assembly protein CpaB
MTYRLRNIGIALALALVAGLLTVFYVTNYKRDVRSAEENVTVWVAARDIPSGTSGEKIAEGGYLEQEEIAKRSVTPGAITSPGQLGDRVAGGTIYAGEQVTLLRFNSESEKGLRAQLTGNLRALQVPGDSHQLMSGTLRDGDHVDVVASMKYRFINFRDSGSSNVNDEMVASRIVLRDIVVLEAPKQTDGNAKLTKPNEQLAAVLAVSDTQAQKLFFVMKNGEWSLQLRPTNDAGDSPEGVETVGSVLGDGLRPEQLRELVFGRRVQ